MGYLFDKDAASLEWNFTPLAEPFFHKGNEVGCLVLHGFTGTPANMISIGQELAGHGCTVYLPRLSGHGTTLGDMNTKNAGLWLDDALRAYDRLVQEGCTKIVLVGLSMGALLMALVASKRKCDGLVMMSAPLYMRNYLLFAHFISPIVPYILTSKELKTDEAGQGYMGMPTRRIGDIKKLAKQVKRILPEITVPTMVMAPANDGRVKKKSPAAIYGGLKKAERKSLVYMENSPHGIPYGCEKERAAEIIGEFVGSL